MKFSVYIFGSFLVFRRLWEGRCKRIRGFAKLRRTGEKMRGTAVFEDRSPICALTKDGRCNECVH